MDFDPERRRPYVLVTGLQEFNKNSSSTRLTRVENCGGGNVRRLVVAAASLFGIGLPTSGKSVAQGFEVATYEGEHRSGQ